MIAASERAQAQDECDRPTEQGPLEITPAVRARSVTLNAIVSVLFSPEYFEGSNAASPEDSFEIFDATDAPVPGQIQVAGDVLFFVPASPFEASTEYRGRAVGQFGFDLDFSFTTGDRTDSEPPQVDRITDTSSTEVPEGCDIPDGGFRISVSFPPATDDGAPDSIEYLLYQTRGTNLAGPVLRSRARNSNTDLFTMAFLLSREDAVEPICVVVRAVDGVGNVRDMPRACLDPVAGNFFEPLCSAVPGSPMSGRTVPRGSPFRLLAFLFLVGAALGWRRSKHRRQAPFRNLS